MMRINVLKTVLSACVVIAACIIYATGASQDGTKTTNSIEGIYNVTAINPGAGVVEFDLKLKKSGEKWSGEMSSTQFPMKLTEVSIDHESNITMKCDSEIGPVSIKGKFANDTFKGTWEGNGANGTWEAVKKKSDQ